MLSGFKSFYSKSVDLLKQVQDTVVVGKPSGPAVPTVEPEDTHPGFHLVDRCRRAGARTCRELASQRECACRCLRTVAPLTCRRARCWSRYERTWGEVVQNASNLSQKVAVSPRGVCVSGGSGIASRSPPVANDRVCVPVQAEDAAVKRFADRCAESQANWGVLQAELAALDGTQKAVAAVREDMEAMCAALKVLDEALGAHIQAKEERDMYKWKGGIEQKTAEFEAGRQADLEEMDKNLKAEQVRQEKLKKAEEDRILREIEARERREAALQAEAARKEKVPASHRSTPPCAILSPPPMNLK
jgi:hypothetical protein